MCTEILLSLRKGNAFDGFTRSNTINGSDKKGKNAFATFGYLFAE
jgi:hypothetical protein